MQDFVHLHVHTQYSILDGQASVARIVDKAMGDGMRGVAITDHGNMMAIKEFFNYTKKKNSGTNADIKKFKKRISLLEKGENAALIEWESEQKKKEKEAKELREKAELNNEPIPEEANFTREEQPEFPTIEEQLQTAYADLEAAKKKLFKPIFGSEVYVAPRRKEQMDKDKDSRRYHLILLAKNETGYHNLVKLVSRSWTDGFYSRPRTDRYDLETYSEGLIVCSACIAGEVPRKILNGDIEGAEETIQWYKRVFGENYYLELQRHEVKNPNQRANRETFPLQQKANAQMIELARKYDVKLVCTNDCHFVNEEDAEAHDRLICLSTNRDLDDPKRMLYSKQEWFKTRAEMNEIFADVPEALSNTCDICDQVEFYSIDHGPIMPNFAIPEEFGTEETYHEKYTDEDLFEEFTRDENGRAVLNEEDAKDVFGIEAENTDIYGGKLNHEGYKSVAKQLADKFGFEKVAITLRSSISASDNDWAGMLYDGENYCFSKSYHLHIVDRVGGGDSFGGGLIYALLSGKDTQAAIEFAVAASALKHSVEGDYNRVSVSEVEKLAGGDGSGRVQR